jgi:hypothetical protein
MNVFMVALFATVMCIQHREHACILVAGMSSFGNRRSFLIPPCSASVLDNSFFSQRSVEMLKLFVELFAQTDHFPWQFMRSSSIHPVHSLFDVNVTHLFRWQQQQQQQQQQFGFVLPSSARQLAKADEDRLASR